MSSIWILIDSIKAPLFFITLAAPFLGLFLGILVGNKLDRSPCRERVYLGGFLSGFAVMPVLVFVTFCTPPPGEGRVAREGKKFVVQLASAVDLYKAKLGQYPDSLRILVPFYISTEAMVPPRGIDTVEYTRTSDSFVITFEYHGPGVNRCDFDSRLRSRWNCSGYF